MTEVLKVKERSSLVAKGGGDVFVILILDLSDQETAISARVVGSRLSSAAALKD